MDAFHFTTLHSALELVIKEAKFIQYEQMGRRQWICIILQAESKDWEIRLNHTQRECERSTLAPADCDIHVCVIMTRHPHCVSESKRVENTRGIFPVSNNRTVLMYEVYISCVSVLKYNECNVTLFYAVKFFFPCMPALIQSKIQSCST